MRRILNNNLSRQLTIMELIVKNSEQSTQQLSKLLDVDDKTVKRDILTINNMIEPLKLIVNEQGNYEVEWLDNYNIKYIYSCFLNSSIEFQIFEKILIDETLTYNELADAVFISISTLRRSLVRMNKVLFDYNVEIATNPFRVRGDERQIISVLQSYLEAKYMVSNRFLSNFENERVDNILVELLPKFNRTWSFTFSEKVKWLVKSHTIRLKNNNMIPYTEGVEPAENTDSDVPISKLELYQDRLKNIFGIPFTNQIIELVKHENYALSLEELYYYEKNNRVINDKVKAIRSIIKGIETKFNVINPAKEELVLMLYNQSLYNYRLPSLLDDSYREFLRELKKDRPLLFDTINELYRKYDSVLTKEKFPDFTFFLITEWRNLLNLLIKEQDKMKVGLFFSTTAEHIEFLKEDFNRKLSNRITLVNLNNVRIYQLDESEVDIIVTDISNLPTSRISICVSTYPDELDLLKISRAYERWLIDEL